MSADTDAAAAAAAVPPFLVVAFQGDSQKWHTSPCEFVFFGKESMQDASDAQYSEAQIADSRSIVQAFNKTVKSSAYYR